MMNGVYVDKKDRISRSRLHDSGEACKTKVER